MTETQEREKRNVKPLLLGLVIGLAVLLVVLLIVAVSVGHSSQTSQPTQPSQPTQQETPAELVFAAPLPPDGTIILEKEFVLAGTADPSQTLTVNEKPVTVSQDGSFSYAVALQTGSNEIAIAYMGQTQTVRLEHRYTVQTFSPMESKTYPSGGSVELNVILRQGSTIKAVFDGKEIAMAEAAKQPEGAAEGFVLYTGSIMLPNNKLENTNLGVVTYTVTCGDVTETYTSGEIICSKMDGLLSSDPDATPNYGNYVDVGSGFIAEVITYSAETFNGKTLDDYSDPRNNYLPEGTMDYCDQTIVYDTTGQIAYRLLRCGRRVYLTKNNYPLPGTAQRVKVPVIECYPGTLPDHNEIGFASMATEGHFTVLTLDTLWKAPFYFDIAPQTYADPSIRNFEIISLTAEYVDITFCYATVFEGQIQIPQNDPLFQSAELIRRDSDCTLRLYLKEKGGFYGWDSYYNSQNQLCFKFLQPTKATASNNTYGADLTGIRILLDVGHGGIDGGACVTGSDGQLIKEADLNLKQALALKKELESMGATVIMNRTDNKNITVEERITFVKEQAPDLCIAVHHNAYEGPETVYGIEVMYFGPTSDAPAEQIYKELKASGITDVVKMRWHLYYVNRQTVCPNLLLECGYMTNPDDLRAMTDDATVQKKAQAIAKGVAKYFLGM
jgi:N-acetylmuramoyl-L-alanine amidase